jgi:GNAT superfamily N-acetyltransferase
MDREHRLNGSIREFDSADFEGVYGVINEAARAYRAVLPAEAYHDPQMTRDELLREVRRIKFLLYSENNRVLGVMGYEYVHDVALIRHAYVLPEAQRKGVGNLLAKVEEAITKSRRVNRIIIGTYKTATWAISFYRKHGYHESASPETALTKYYDIPLIQRLNSLTLEKDLE